MPEVGLDEIDPPQIPPLEICTFEPDANELSFAGFILRKQFLNPLLPPLPSSGAAADTGSSQDQRKYYPTQLGHRSASS